MRGDSMRNYLDLTGKIALVTGASSGIGAATARVLAEQGAAVAIHTFIMKKAPRRRGRRSRKAAVKAIIVHADVRASQDISSMINAVRAKLGPIDILSEQRRIAGGTSPSPRIDRATLGRGFRSELEERFPLCPGRGAPNEGTQEWRDHQRRLHCRTQ